MSSYVLSSTSGVMDAFTWASTISWTWTLRLFVQLFSCCARVSSTTCCTSWIFATSTSDPKSWHSSSNNWETTWVSSTSRRVPGSQASRAVAILAVVDRSSETLRNSESWSWHWNGRGNSRARRSSTVSTAWPRSWSSSSRVSTCTGFTRFHTVRKTSSMAR